MRDNMVSRFITLANEALPAGNTAELSTAVVIRSTVRQLSMPIEIIAAETARDPARLALSSRNHSLTAALLAEAHRLNAVLAATRAATESGRTDWRVPGA